MEIVLANPFKQTVKNVDAAGIVMENVLCDIEPLSGKVDVDELHLLKKRCRR